MYLKFPNLGLWPPSSFCGASAHDHFLCDPDLYMASSLVFGRELSRIEKLWGRQVRKPGLVGYKHLKYM